MNKRQKNKAFKKLYKQVGKFLDAHFGQFVTAKHLNDAAEWAEKTYKDVPPPEY